MFITTKFYPGHRDPAAEAAQSLKRLGVDQVDLYLVHWPQGGPTRAWPGMEQAHKLGHARSIGVSNFNVAELQAVLGAATIAPVVNQVQFSPVKYRRRLLEECRQSGVVLEAYSPLGTSRYLSDRAVKAGGRTGRAHAGPGAFALVRAALGPGHTEIDAPRTDRGKRRHFRFHPVVGGYGRAGRSGRNPGHRPRS